MARNSVLSGTAGFSKVDFSQVDGHYEEWSVGLACTWQLTRAMRLTTSITHFDRTSTFVDGGFSENRALIMLGYGSGSEPRTNRRPPVFGVDALPSLEEER
jgi:hypothetical protein